MRAGRCLGYSFGVFVLADDVCVPSACQTLLNSSPFLTLHPTSFILTVLDLRVFSRVNFTSAFAAYQATNRFYYLNLSN